VSHPIHRLTAWQSAVFLVNSRLGPFTAALCSRIGHPFFRSYGVNLLSSLTAVLSSTLGYSPHLPESVYGTIGKGSRLEDFLGSGIRAGLWPRASHLRFSLNRADLPTRSAYALRPSYPIDGRPFTSASPHRSNDPPPAREYSTRFPSPTPLGLDLGIG